MKKKIDQILKDLYSIDPEMKKNDTQIRKIVGELLTLKPDSQFSKKFMADLKMKLAEQIETKSAFSKRGPLFSAWLEKLKETISPLSGRRRIFAGAAVSFAAVVIVTAVISINHFSKNITEQEIPDQAVYYTTADGVKDKKAAAPSIEKSRDADMSVGGEVALNEQQSGLDERMEERSTQSGAPVPAQADKMAKESELMTAKPEKKMAEKAKVKSKQDFNTEAYNRIYENEFLSASSNPLSTFSIDVDTASYSNARRFLNSGTLPPPDAVRTEEFINYFTYDYPLPEGKEPFTVNTETGECPWDKNHRIVHIGIQGKDISKENLPPSNLVFLIDVSGSMEEENKIHLLKKAYRLLVNELTSKDRIAIVVYSGAAGVVLPSTPGNKKEDILAAIDKLEAGGSTAGSEGIKLAYDIAKKNLIKGGNNRIILATDGDFNVGQSSDAELERLIEKKKEEGVFLTVLGFGMGNYKDSKMEIIADKGNGNYAYIDSLLEAKKVLVNDIRGTLFTIAKDVKIQVEFNPAYVKEYRLLGYENRLMKKEDFDDDKKDAGELGAGHHVTALYEIVPADGASSGDKPLKYQETKVKEGAGKTGEIMTIKLRYKEPDGSVSKLIEKAVMNETKEIGKTSDNFRFSAAVAEFSLILRESKFKGKSSFKSVTDLAKGSKGKDSFGYREEFLKLVKSAEKLSGKKD